MVEQFPFHQRGDLGFLEERVTVFLALGEGFGDCFVAEDVQALERVWGRASLPFGNRFLSFEYSTLAGFTESFMAATRGD